jgi:hypothetical protein
MKDEVRGNSGRLRPILGRRGERSVSSKKVFNIAR